MDAQQQYFDDSYRTGADIWTHLPYRDVAEAMLPELPADSLVLDVGSGRGLWALRLVALGYHVIGIDYAPSIIAKLNREIDERGLRSQARFIEASVLDIPFTDISFDLVTDIGTLQHLREHEWQTYYNEVARVIKPGGYYLSVLFSRNTTRFRTWTPSIDPAGRFEKYGVSYYFFTDQEVRDLFTPEFEVVEQKTVPIGEAGGAKGDAVSLLFTLMKKNS